MNRLLLLLFLGSFWQNLQAQPYVDPLQLRHTYAFRNNGAFATPHNHFYIGSDLPLKIKEKTYFILSPFYERWQIDSGTKKDIIPTVQSLALPAGLLFPLNNKWSMTFMGILRKNGEALFGMKNTQLGATAFASYAATPAKKLRFGLYANSDFFGFFLMPLLGTDWRIDAKNYLFGLLPGRLTWEHQWTPKLYGGLTFRAITNSFRLTQDRYLRLDDNQLSAFIDFYPMKQLCLTLEPGYGLLRKIRIGTEKRKYTLNENWGDGAFIKLSGAWRVRL